MEFIVEEPGKVPSRTRRKEVTSGAARSTWKCRAIRGGSGKPGEHVFSVQNSKVKEHSTLPTLTGSSSVSPTEGSDFCGPLRSLSPSTVSSLWSHRYFQDLPHEVLDHAFEYYCRVVASTTSRVHGLPSQNVDQAGHDGLMSALINEALREPVLLCSLLAISLVYQDRRIIVNRSTKRGLVFLQLQNTVIVELRQRVTEQSDSLSTALAIAHLVLIDAVFGVADETSELHCKGLEQVLAKTDTSKPGLRGSALLREYLMIVVAKARLISYMHLDSKVRSISDAPSSTEEPSRDEIHPTVYQGMPALSKLCEQQFVSSATLEYADQFFEWAQTSPPSSGSLEQTLCLAKDDIDCQTWPNISYRSIPVRVSGSWRPLKVIDSLYNSDKLILLALFSIADALAGIGKWPLWKLDFATWHVVLNQFDSNDVLPQQCLVWCLTNILSETDLNVVSADERRKLLRIARSRCPQAAADQEAVEISISQFCWVSRTLPSLLDVWSDFDSLVNDSADNSILGSATSSKR